MKDFFGRYLTFGLTPEQAMGAYIFSYRAAIIGALLAGWGLFSPIISGFANATDVDSKIGLSQQQITKQLDENKAQLAQTTKLLNRQLAAGIASQIRAQAAKRCPPATSKDREAANKEIDRLQEEYKEFTDERYGIPDCGAL